jgi:hypothetical protein
MTLSAQFGGSAREPLGDGDDPLSRFDRPFPGVRLAAAIFLSFAVLALSIEGTTIAAPLWRSVLLLAIAGLPLAAATTPIFGVFTGRPLSEAGWVAKLAIASYAGMIAALTMLQFNVHFDRAPPQAQAFPILAKRTAAGDGGGDYGVIVEMAARRVWPWKLSGEPSREYVWVFSSDFYRIVPGSSVIVLDIHPGALGLPWYRRYRYELR